MNRLLILLIISCAFYSNNFAQQIPIGSWQSHYSNSTANAIELIGEKIFSGSNHILSYSLTNKEYTTYSKVNGMSDFNVKFIRYDPSTNFTIIIYENSNIDLMQGETFFNIPDIKNKNLIGSKRINSVFFYNQLMYLATDFGIVVLNPIKKEIKESYVLQNNVNVLPINDITIANNKFLAATSNGIYSINVNNTQLQNYLNWQLINSKPISHLSNYKNTVFASVDSLLYTIQDTNLVFRYSTVSPITVLRNGQSYFYVVENGEAKKAITCFNENAVKQFEVIHINPTDVVEVSNHEFWVSDGWSGMVRFTNEVTMDKFAPNSIYSNQTFSAKVLSNQLYISAGSQDDWTFTYNSAGISVMDENGNWKSYNRFVGTPALDTITDILDVELDKRNNYIYAASFIGGLVEIHPDNTVAVFKHNGYIEDFGGTYRVTNLLFDENHNLWMSDYGADASLVVKKADGSWQKFKFPYAVSNNTASELAIDNAGQVWMVAPRNVGVFVLNTNNTIDNKNDDQIKFLQKGAGIGNLPNNDVHCIAKDKNGKLWIGTSDGIGIINCPESIMSTSGCDAELKVVKYDLDAGHLFQNENVKTIAVDGANNKWIGTDNGVWLISDDAEKIIFHYTKDNSPLPTNEINKIAINQTTGIVYFATSNGLISFRANATDGNTSNDNLLIFPNPIESDYKGTIAIKGLVENADVKITDVAGQLVYKTKAQGGQAIWNGKNYLNQRPRTGVYYVFVTNADGSETKTGKFIFNE